MARAARGSGLNLMGAAVSAVANFMLTVAVTRGAPKDIAGILFAITSVFLMASSIGRLGTDTGLVYFIAKSRADQQAGRIRDYVTVALRPVLIAAAVMVGLMALSGPVFSGFIGNDHRGLVVQYLIALAVFIPFAGVENVALSATRGLGTMRPNALIEQVGRPLVQYAMVLLALKLDNTALLAAAWGFCYAPAAVFAWVALRRRLARINDDRAGRSTSGREFWSFTAPRSAASIMQLALQRLDIVLVAVMVGPAQAAVYTAATRFVVLGQMGRNAVSLAVQPDLAQSLHRGDRHGTNALYQATTAWLMLVTWPVYLTLCLQGDLVLRLFGSGYVEGADVLVLVSAGMLIATLCGDVDVVLIMAGRTSWSLVNVTGALVVNVVLDLVLIPHFGILGAAIGWSVAIVTKNLSALVQVAIVLRLHPFGSATLAAGVLCVIGFAVTPLASELMGAAPSTRLSFLVLGLGVFTVGALLLRTRLQLTAFLAHRRRLGVSGARMPDR